MGDFEEIDTGYLDAKSAAALDEELMSTPGFTLEQLMELAGFSVAEAVYTVLNEESKPSDRPAKILLVCGPGNNGGDGLVAARHLTMFGFECVIVYPKRSSRQPHYTNLVQQCQGLSIKILEEMPENYGDYQVIVDAIFGFSFEGTPREPFATILKQIQHSQADNNSLVVAVDVPSGWHVNDGDVLGTGYLPDVLVSLTTPKLSAKNYPKRHFVGGRFLPPALAEKYNVRMPPYPGVAQVMEINRGGATRWEKEYAEFLAAKEAKEFATYADDKHQTHHPQQERDVQKEGEWEEDYALYLAEKEKGHREEETNSKL
eukprot:CAMPEP_0198151394 /NCGR_PEP_ID=MMETSP1443-20131203/55523_1 /TAXON_ID=186043 /ORGANISM="Entomoneis sp., Strain CCMP2396" /LENGTH=315 /DNA_ID=CAMNT_0043817041 /DNA_START=231 /DNA_END=1178 /DNA_ORIENTATION=-